MAELVRATTVLSHWSMLIEGLQTSSLEFYTAVEQLIARRNVPEGHASRINWKEGGLHTANREYLRLMIEEHEESLKMHEKWAREATNEEIRDYARRTAPVIKDHLEQARRLAASREK